MMQCCGGRTCQLVDHMHKNLAIKFICVCSTAHAQPKYSLASEFRAKKLRICVPPTFMTTGRPRRRVYKERAGPFDRTIVVSK